MCPNTQRFVLSVWWKNTSTVCWLRLSLTIPIYCPTYTSYRPGCFPAIAGIPGQSQNRGILLQKTLKNTQGGTVADCEGRLPAYHRAWFPPDLRLMNAGTESRLSGNNCQNIGKNVKCENELEQRLPETAVCRVQRCADLRLAISIDGGVLKHKIQVYIFRTLTGGPSVKSRQPMNKHWCIVN